MLEDRNKIIRVIPINRKAFAGRIMVALLALIVVNVYLYFLLIKNNWNSIFDIVVAILSSISSLIYISIYIRSYRKTAFDPTTSWNFTEGGIDDNLTIFAFGLIRWEDIVETRINKHLDTEILSIHVQDNKAYLGKMSRFQRFFLKQNLKRWGSPICVMDKRLDFDLVELKNLIDDKIILYEKK